MKLSRLLALLFAVAFLSSCGSSDSTESTGTDTTKAEDSNTTKSVTMPANTIVTTEESMVSVIHKVSDFDKWQPAYESHDSARVANGIHSYVIGQGYNDRNMVLVALKVDDMAKARTFVKDPSLKTAMQKGGVVGAPDISFLTAVWQDTSMLAPGVIRSRSSFTVKDWDAWFKQFQDSKQQRIDNGIVDRVIGHEANDNKKVTLVTALVDTAKAFAFYKSDLLKQTMATHGVVGEPKRFLFTVSKRY